MNPLSSKHADRAQDTNVIVPELPVTCRPVASDQPASPRIFIFGCARSGTTLLLNLFRTFRGVTVLDGEHCCNTLLGLPARDVLVAKRTPHCADHLLDDVQHLREAWIIDIIRDPRDVVTSKLDPWPGFYCDFSRWKRDVEVIGKLRGRHLRLIHLRYEDLISRADQIQTDLAAILGFEVHTRFSKFGDVTPHDLSPQARTALGGVRPLSMQNIGRWLKRPPTRQRVQQQLNAHPEMELMLTTAGYPATDWSLLE